MIENITSNNTRRAEQLKAFERLLDVLDELRVKCPWDKKQTNESLRPNTIEETYELCDALMKDDKKNICKELGDVLLHVCFYAKIGSETAISILPTFATNCATNLSSATLTYFRRKGAKTSTSRLPSK